MKDERTFHAPRYFDKVVTEDSNGAKIYTYTPATKHYWEARDRGDWSKAPRIYDDNCAPFF